jgi:hypothetical protein
MMTNFVITNCKVFERVIFEYIYNFLIDNSLIYKYQTGFMHKHSIVHQLIEIYHSICLALENHEIICSVFCNISKAFDRVWHKGLIKKSEGYGITGNLLHWLENYLRKIINIFKNHTFKHFTNTT